MCKCKVYERSYKIQKVLKKILWNPLQFYAIIQDPIGSYAILLGLTGSYTKSHGKLYERSYEILINCLNDPMKSYKIVQDPRQSH